MGLGPARGAGVTFASPAWLWALLLLPALAAVEWWAARRDAERTARFVSRALWPRVARQPSPRWRLARLLLLLLGAAGFVLALARPQWGIVREKVEREGVDVVFVLDTSGSMASADVPPNRFFLARAALLSLAQRLEGDRLALLAFEGEAYPLVPLTLDADALGLFLDTLEPGVVPTPGTSLGLGLERGLELFVDEERRNKVMVLVSDGEDLEGQVEAAVRHSKEAGVVVHTVGVGTEQGDPVPSFDAQGNPAGYKKLPDGSPVISRLDAGALEAIARGTGGRFFRLSASDTSLSALAAAIEGMEQKSLSREYSYRRKERFQVPLGLGLLATFLGLVLPLPLRRRGALAAAALGVMGLLGQPAAAEEPPKGRVVDELLLRPNRLTEQGRDAFQRGNHPEALKSFEAAAQARPEDPRARFNVGAGLYKNGRYDEAGALFKALGQDARAPLSAAARFNLGNALLQRQDYAGAVQAYREALRAEPGAPDVRRNLELALRALQEQKQQQQQQEQQQKDQKDQKDRQQQDQQQQDQARRTRSRGRRTRSSSNRSSRAARGPRTRPARPSSASRSAGSARPACPRSARCSCSRPCSRTSRRNRRS